uniref:Uncharacterized protein n=1 Tax=Anopheles epiroticus TaxID=199890 RepID=A0A182PY98_9DIPT
MGHGKMKLYENLERLKSLEEIPVKQLEQSRKFLTHFINILQRGCEYDEVLFETLFCCQAAMVKSNGTERESSTVTGTFNILFEIAKRDYVCPKVAFECVATLYKMIVHLKREELTEMHDMFKKKMDPYEPRVECSYEQILIEGPPMKTFYLRINVLNNEHLDELVTFLKHRIPADRITITPLTPNCEESEILIHREQLCNTIDITDIALQPEHDHGTDYAYETEAQNGIAHDKTPEKEEDLVIEMPATNVSVNNAANISVDNPANVSILSVPEFPPLGTTKWPYKLIDLSDKMDVSNYDPYDVANELEDHRRHMKKQGKKAAPTKRTNGELPKRPIYMNSSTPTKRKRSATMQNIPNGIEAISSIYYISDDAQSDSNDEEYIPYSMLSKAANSKRARNQRQSQKQSFPSTRKMAAPANCKNAKEVAANHTNNKVQPRAARKSNVIEKENQDKRKQPPLNGSRYRLPLGPTSSLQSPTTNGISNCKSISPSHITLSTEKGHTPPQQSVPATILNENNASPARSMNGNCDYTLRMALVPYESIIRTDSTTTRNTISSSPTSTSIQKLLESNIQPRIAKLQQLHAERLRAAACKAQELQAKDREAHCALKASFEQYSQNVEKLENSVRKIMAERDQYKKIHNELRRMRMEAEQHDKEFVEQIKTMQSILPALIQTAKGQVDQQYRKQLAKEMVTTILGSDVDLQSCLS